MTSEEIFNYCITVDKLKNRVEELKKYSYSLQQDQVPSLAVMMIVEYGLNVLNDKAWITNHRKDKKNKLRKELVKLINTFM